jgi:hypothetical protein
METTLIEILCRGSALIAGVAIGGAFAILQNVALRRHEQQQKSGKLKSGWTLMPGAGARVAYFLIALLLVQICCPILFVDGTQWWVSAGVVVGYGWFLVRQLRERLRLVRPAN